jgi:inositol phosphorylceramide mannosyltransferase catalytic subunit
MKFPGPRARRVMDALTDFTSYRLLFESMSNPFLSAEKCDVKYKLSDEPGSSGEVPFEDRKRIPKNIFQTWKSHHDIPANYRYWRDSFLINNPDFRYFFWDDADNLRFITNRFSWFLKQYKDYPREIFRADLVRLFFLYRHGGFYADMDSECLRPLHVMCDMGDVLVGRMGRDPIFEHSIPNAIMASKSKQAFWLLVIALAVNRLGQSPARDDVRPEWYTGPILLKDAVDFYRSHSSEAIREYILRTCPDLAPEVSDSDFGEIRILPRAVWYPVNWNNFMQTPFRNRMLSEKGVLDSARARRLFPHAFIVTYWSASWK